MFLLGCSVAESIYKEFSLVPGTLVSSQLHSLSLHLLHAVLFSPPCLVYLFIYFGYCMFAQLPGCFSAICPCLIFLRVISLCFLLQWRSICFLTLLQLVAWGVYISSSVRNWEGWDSVQLWKSVLSISTCPSSAMVLNILYSFLERCLWRISSIHCGALSLPFHLRE